MKSLLLFMEWREAGMIKRLMEWKYGPATTQSTTSIPIQSQIKTTFCFEFVWLNGLMVDEFVGGRPTIAAQLPAASPIRFVVCFIHHSAKQQPLKLAPPQPAQSPRQAGLLSLLFVWVGVDWLLKSGLFVSFSTKPTQTTFLFFFNKSN